MVQTHSYKEIWSKIHVIEELHSSEPDLQQQLVIAQVLEPDRESVQEVLNKAPPSTFTQLVTTYFEQTEKFCHLLLLLHHGMHCTNSLYALLLKLVDILPDDIESMSDLQCNLALENFLEFNEKGNPFPYPESHNFRDMLLSFSELKLQVDQRPEKHQVHCGTTASAICLIGTVVGVTISAVAIGAHALVALVATITSPIFLPSKISKKEVAHMAQPDAVRSAFVLNHDLDTIYCLASRIHAEIEGDRSSIRLGLGCGKDKYTIYEVVKLLSNKLPSFNEQLTELETHICRCFSAINEARNLLLTEINLYQI